MYKYFIRTEKCRMCMKCVNVCPLGAIVETPEGTLVIDQDVCDSCGLCKDSCSLRVITQKKVHGRLWGK